MSACSSWCGWCGSCTSREDDHLGYSATALREYAARREAEDAERAKQQTEKAKAADKNSG